MKERSRRPEPLAHALRWVLVLSLLGGLLHPGAAAWAGGIDGSGAEGAGESEGALASRQDPVPVPVVLVPGWGDGEAALDPLRARFIEAGWPPGRVVSVGFEDPYGSNRMHAEEVGAEARALRKATGADEIDLVAHSMGGLAVRLHLASTGGSGIRRVVFLATPHRGTVSAHLAWGEGGEEMEPGSPFLDSLNARPPVPEGVQALSVRTVLDLRVVPGASAVLPDGQGIRNVEICCPTHPGLLDDPQAFRLVASFLRRGPEAVPAAGSGRTGGRRGGAARPTGRTTFPWPGAPHPGRARPELDARAAGLPGGRCRPEAPPWT